MSCPRGLNLSPARPVDALRALANQLEAHGRLSLYGAACSRMGVLSVAHGLTVWCDGHQFWWQTDHGNATWPVSDPDGAVRHLLE